MCNIYLCNLAEVYIYIAYHLFNRLFPFLINDLVRVCCVLSAGDGEMNQDGQAAVVCRQGMLGGAVFLYYIWIYLSERIILSGPHLG